jgi:chromate transporter
VQGRDGRDAQLAVGGGAAGMSEAVGPAAEPEAHGIAFGEGVAVWARVAAMSFGGPAGQIAVMHRIVVDEKRWVGERRFLHALNFCMLLPGPEAHQLAIYLGWLMHGVRGGLVAGTLFVLPGFLVMLGLSAVYAAWGRTGAVEGLFFGLKAAVLAIVLQAVVRIGRRSLGGVGLRWIAAAAFVAIFAFGVPFPLIVLAAGLVGWAGGRRGWPAFRAAGHGKGGGGLADADSLLGTGATPTEGTRRAAAAMLLLWLVPVAALVLALGPDAVFARLAVFFSQMAVVTFGGAYAVLAYVAQQAVEHYGWLAPGEMLDGLGLAETTPGPLILVVEFVGFLAAFRAPGALDPWLAAVLGATVVTWVTFVPSFFWIFLGAPHVERLRGNAALAGALAAIGAAVVGVILNLAVWFALHTVFGRVVAFGPLELPDPVSLDAAALVLTVGAVAAVFRLGLGMAPLLATWAGLGLAWWAVGGM